MSITLFATVSVKPGQSVAVRKELEKMLAPSRAETGCERYELYQAEQDENTLHLIERYVDRAALDTHANSAYFKNLVDNISPLLEKSLDITYITELA
ncbi:MAG: putative quinol monooxygenase [Rhizomicrobium sp.]